MLSETEVKIVDIHSGETLPPGKKGLVKLRGTPVMKGYYKVVCLFHLNFYLELSDVLVLFESMYESSMRRMKMHQDRPLMKKAGWIQETWDGFSPSSKWVQPAVVEETWSLMVVQKTSLSYQQV